jgi:hypothetical protein
MRRILGAVAALFVAAFAVFLWSGYHTTEPTGDITTDVFGAEEVRSVFATAQTVTVQRLHWRDQQQNPRKLENYDRGAPVPVPDDTVRELRALFQQPDSFAWKISKSCAPDYGVLFTFHSPQREVQLALCFQCGIFGIYDAGSEVNAEEDFDAIAKKLIQLTKPLFPNDTDIQGLK